MMTKNITLLYFLISSVLLEGNKSITKSVVKPFNSSNKIISNQLFETFRRSTFFYRGIIGSNIFVFVI